MIPNIAIVYFLSGLSIFWANSTRLQDVQGNFARSWDIFTDAAGKNEQGLFRIFY